MGLDTRRDRDGNPLPAPILRQLHAGDSDNGGYNTNTLILVHVPSDRTRITAVSIPRDSYVELDGVGVPRAKIKEAYGRKKFMAEEELRGQGVDDPAEVEHLGREAGRRSTIAAVEKFTGVQVDRFVEVSLVGFFDVAQALGAVEVCVNASIRDPYSGADLRRGVNELSASQALAFVRQRHGLAHGDIDRTRRQQAFLASALRELESSGALTNVSKLSALFKAVRGNVVVSRGWDLVDFVADTMADSGPQIRFDTLPVERYDTVDGQDVNIVDPQTVRQRIATLFGTAPSASAPAPVGSHGGVSTLKEDPAAKPDPRAPAVEEIRAGGGLMCVD